MNNTPNNTASPQKRALVILTVMMVATLEVLDSTIVNVSLPHMMASLGANSEQITWVLTSYVVVSAIIMPLTGLLEQRIGRKQLLIINITGFMLSSILCGIATSLEMMVTCRALQGGFGASLIPLSQVVLNNTFPGKERPKAMAIWGVGLMATPVLGPTLGGFITEHMNWRWVFYINIPGCLLSLFLASVVIPTTPTHKRPIDWIGMVLMVISIGGLQLVLDQGNANDWWESDFILISTIVVITALISFVIRGWQRPHHIINFALFKNRNFNTATLIMMLFCGALFGDMVLQPLMLESVMGYSAIDAGLIMGPRGIACAIAMALVTPLMQHFSGRTILIFATILCAYGTWAMTQYTVNINLWALIWPTIIQGIGIGLFFVPLAAMATADIKPQESAEASGLFNYGRMLGNSIGISVISTLINRSGSMNWQTISSHINLYNPALIQWLTSHHWSIMDRAPLQYLTMQSEQQASMTAFLNSNVAVTYALLALIPLIMLMRTSNHSTSRSSANRKFTDPS